MSVPVRPILLGIVGAPHGVRGEVRVKSYTADPLDLRAYGPLWSAEGRRFDIVSLRPAKEVVVVRFAGIDDRTAAEALNGVRLHVDRDRLPPPEDDDDFLQADLIGLAAETAAGEALGRVIAVHNFGAGDTLEVQPPRGPSVYYPFTRAVVPTVDIAGGRLIVVPPEEVEGEAGRDGG